MKSKNSDLKIKKPKKQAFSFANTRWAKNGPCRIT